MTKVARQCRQSLHPRCVNFFLAQSWRQQVRKSYGRMQVRLRQQRADFFCYFYRATHLGEVVMNDCYARHETLSERDQDLKTKNEIASSARMKKNEPRIRLSISGRDSIVVPGPSVSR